MSWGKIYCDTNWGENKYRTAGSIINEATPDCFQFPEFVSFKDHVRSEGATYEKMQCGIDILLFLGRSISITPQSPDNPTFSGILDTYTGATAGYSTRRLTNTYTGGLIRVRRSSDDAEQDIGYDANGEDLDIFGLLAFVNASYTNYQSDFSSTGQDDLEETNGTGAIDQSVGGVDEAYLFTNTATGTCYTQIRNLLDVGQTTRIQLDYYIPSGQDCDMVILRGDSIEYTRGTTVGSWASIDITATTDRDDLFLFLADGGSLSLGSTGNELYLKNIVITQTTADGHVTTFYDQTGNGNHATNSTASEQPLIVDGGSIIYAGATISRPAVDFDGVDDNFDISNFTSVPTISQFNVLKPSATNVDETFTSIQNATTTDGIFLGQGNLGTEAKFGLRNYQGADIADSGIAMTLQQYLLAAITTSTTAQIYANGVAGAISAKARGNVTGDTQIGANGASGNNFSGKFQEIIIFESDQSANRTGIEGNIDNYFRITS